MNIYFLFAIMLLISCNDVENKTIHRVEYPFEKPVNISPNVRFVSYDTLLFGDDRIDDDCFLEYEIYGVIENGDKILIKSGHRDRWNKNLLRFNE